MKTNKPRITIFIIGVSLLLGPPNLVTQLQSQASKQRQATLTQPSRLQATAVAQKPEPDPKPENISTNIINQLADIPTIQTNDPFANTFAMLQRAASDNPITSTLSAMTGSSDLQLKGTVVDSSDTSLALIEVGRTGVHVVRVGDTLSLSGGGRSANVTILAIHRQKIEVEYGNFEDTIIIR